MLALYNALMLPLRAVRPVAGLWITRDRARVREWRERTARDLPRVPPGGWWIHGASLGEARLVGAIAAAARDHVPDLPLSTSCVTPAGREALPEPPEVAAAFFAPLDFPGLPGRVADAVRPSALVLVETELWPNLVHETGVRGIPRVIVNGRLAPRRMNRYRRWRSLYGPLLRNLDAVGVQSEADLERFRSLGVPADRLSLTGNIKFDLSVPTVDRAEVRAEAGIALDVAVLIAGSTREGEESPILEAFRQVRALAPDTRLVLAPRHVRRADEVARLAEEAGYRTTTRSSGKDPGAEVLVVDRLGELTRLYAAADAAFVGGTLAEFGGHNVLEPAAAGIPTAFGPHTAHVAEIAETLVAAGAADRVRDADGLARAWIAVLTDEGARAARAARAREVVSAHRGALARSIALVRETARSRGARSRGPAG